MFHSHLRSAAAVCLLSAFGLLARAAAPFELRDGDKVLFMGDTIFEREVDYGWIETRLTAAFPDRNVTFRNLSWAGDTPTGRARASFDWNQPEANWLGRVKEQLGLVKPTVAILDYAMTASFDGEEGVGKYTSDLGKLMEAITQVSGQPVRFVLVGPIAHETDNPKDAEAVTHNASLKLYNLATQKFAAEHGAIFADLFTKHPGKSRLTTDGVTPNESGNEAIATAVVEQLAPNVGQHGPTKAAQNLRAAVLKKNELFFHRWRPANWTYLFGFRKNEQGQNSVEMPKFDPLITEWEARIAKLRALSEQDPAAVNELTGILAEEARVRAARPAPQKPQAVPTFDMADGFEATLWAESPNLFKPIQMNFDEHGRLWVASSRVYPMIRPGQEAEDSIIVLEDSKGTGHADKATVFADGLLIPSGVLPDSQRGCYVAASHQLLYFRDTNGDGKADEKRIVLSSFGTEDTHHNLHTLRWGPDGHLFLNQSIYTHTHIETPHGIRRLNSAGIWRFDPTTWQLEVYTKGGCNPWGHHWDEYGVHFFSDGAGFKGIYHAMEGATYFTYSDMRREAESISPGNYPKFASLEYVRSPAFPADWQGNLITCDFRAHRVVRFALNEVGSSFVTKEMPDLMRSTNVTFRPIDVRFGPDGALYIADWSNPIIQHGEVDFRDPRRDHEHGRIWRVVAKGQAIADASPVKKLAGWVEATSMQKSASIPKREEPQFINQLLNATLSNNGWEQQGARNLLRTLGVSRVNPHLAGWITKQTDERAALEALWLRESWGLTSPDLLAKLATSPNPKIRAAAAHAIMNSSGALADAATR